MPNSHKVCAFLDFILRCIAFHLRYADLSDVQREMIPAGESFWKIDHFRSWGWVGVRMCIYAHILCECVYMRTYTVYVYVLCARIDCMTVGHIVKLGMLAKD